MNTKAWTFLGMIGWVTKVKPEDLFQHHRLEYNPGLHYEEIDQVRMVNKKWKLLLTIDVHNLMGNPLPGLKIIQKHFLDCSKQIGPSDCYEVLGCKIMDDNAKEFHHLQEHL